MNFVGRLLHNDHRRQPR